MPIRTGSGGLKYQLPSQAQLYAQQSAASASAGGSASASAFGTRMGLIAQGRKLRYDEMQSQYDRDFRAEQAFYQREHEMGAQLERQAFTMDRDRQQNLYAQENFERGVDARIEEGIRTGQIELPPAALQRLQKIEADQASFRGTPAQMEEARQKFEAEKRAVLRQARRAPSVAGEVNRNIVHYDPKTGKSYDQPIDGVTQPRLAGPNGLGPIDQVAEAEKVAKAKQAEMQSKQAQVQAQAQAKQADSQAKEQARQAKAQQDAEDKALEKQAEAQAKQDQEYKAATKEWKNKVSTEAARKAKEWNDAHKDDEKFEPKQPSDYMGEAKDEVARQGFDEPEKPEPVKPNLRPQQRIYNAPGSSPGRAGFMAGKGASQTGFSPAEQAYLDDIQKQSPNAPLTDQEKAQFVQFYRNRQGGQAPPQPGIPAQPANVVPPPPQPGIPAQQVPPPPQPGIPPQQANVPQVAPPTQGPPIPAGAPAGSAWVDANTLQYPDGRVFRKKGTPPAGAPKQQVGIGNMPAGYTPPVRAPKKKQGYVPPVPYQG